MLSYEQRTMNYQLYSTFVEYSLQIHPFLTNKANFQKSQVNVSSFITMNYEQRTMNCEIKNKAKTKPIQTQFKANTNPKQTQYKAKQTQFIVSLPALSVVEWAEPISHGSCLLFKQGKKFCSPTFYCGIRKNYYVV
jgi:hypothetical protein